MLIGIDVELADQMVSSLSTQSEAISDELTRVGGVVNTLLGTWQGGSRATFENAWNPLVTEVNDLIGYMLQLRDRLQKTADGFRQADVF